MIMTIDVGNTTMTGGIFEGDNLVLQFRRSTSSSQSSDEIGLFLRDVLLMNNFDYKQIDRISCCSVVPQINHSLQNAFKKYFKVPFLFIQPGIKNGLKIKYANPKEIGADRIAAAIGAAGLEPNKNLIVIDMGTATTVDIVTASKEYLGGAILPGISMSVRSLASGTAQLPNVEVIEPKKCCGTTTIEAIQSGIFYGQAGSIKELCSLYKENIFGGKKPYIIGTGGFSSLFKDYNIFDVIVPDLVLQGLKNVLALNP